jgi:hypothetical protein
MKFGKKVDGGIFRIRKGDDAVAKIVKKIVNCEIDDVSKRTNTTFFEFKAIRLADNSDSSIVVRGIISNKIPKLVPKSK